MRFSYAHKWRAAFWGDDPDYYDTLAACRENVVLLTKLAKEHRVDSSSEKLWFECRSKRVETWEATEP